MKKPDSSREPPLTPVKNTLLWLKATTDGRVWVRRSATAWECATPSVRWSPLPPPQKRFGSGAKATTPRVLACTAWFGKSKKDCPPSPCSSMLMPSALWSPAAAVPPVRPEVVVKRLAGAETLKRIGRLLHGRFVRQFYGLSWYEGGRDGGEEYLMLTVWSRIVEPSVAVEMPPGICAACCCGVCTFVAVPAVPAVDAFVVCFWRGIAVVEGVHSRIMTDRATKDDHSCLPDIVNKVFLKKCLAK